MNPCQKSTHPCSPLIELTSDRLQYVGVTLRNPHHVTVYEGITAVVGPNGSGKSSFARILERGWNFTTNRISSPRGKLRVRSIEFSDIHSLTGFKAEYYQQRFESSMNDEVPTVAQLLGERIHSPLWQEMKARLHLADTESKRANFLSSGELRKLLIINMLFDLPDLLVLDNPYIGLDPQSRDVLNETLIELRRSGVTLMLLLCDPAEIPQSADWVIPVADMTVGTAIKPTGYMASDMFDFRIDESLIPHSIIVKEESSALVELHDCTVRYGHRIIIDHVDWTVRRGECWTLTGPNGSGKSTLLSLIHADNPQGYSNHISLFGRRRGSGESIWDIKRRIGYVSPEMHLYFNGGNNTVADVIAGGLNDTVGCFKRITPSQHEQAWKWIRLLQLDDLAQRPFNSLSTGEQRMVLMARTFIKNPELLILDEPLHGLDCARKRALRTIINRLADCGSTIIYVTHYTPEVPECVSHTKALPHRI